MPSREDGFTVSEVHELRPSTSAAAAIADTPELIARRARPRRRRLSPWARRELLWITVIYLAVRIAILIAAYLNGTFGHHDIQGELAHWDGLWYRELANHGYPGHVSYLQTTLGFFPLYPLTIWLLEPVFTTLTVHNQIWASTVSGIVISGIGGWVATVMVHRLARSWWGVDVARRATILFVVFPGAIIFSMVYSEGLLLPLAAGCLYALQKRRWVLAGVLAGLGTAVQPVGLVLVFSCAVTALLEFRRCGWSWKRARASLAAPALSVSGAAAFAAFLWAWTGSPFANYIAQHHGWSEKTDPLAIVHLATRLAAEISFSHFNEPSVNLNLVVGLAGTVLLVVMLVLMWYSRHEVSAGAIVWTLGIAVLALTSEYVPPNPRMLITAFPALIVLARYVRGKWFHLLVTVSFVLLVVLAPLTFVSTTLRP
ncbi:MAG: mannosyltransferase family protein [Solirubrobacteraceae bacterium]